MVKIACEMCGSSDLIKQDGVFVCQHCGCKYSVEEARKLMVEGTVDVSGSTVMIDNTASVQKYLQNARRAKAKEDWEETEKYYNLVEQNDPDNIEAIFYSAYGKAKSSLIEDDIYKRQQAFKVLTNCVSIIDDNYKNEDREDNKAALEDMCADIIKMCFGNFVFKEWKNGYGVVVRDDKTETYVLFIRLCDMFIESVNNIIAKDDQRYLHDILIRIYDVLSVASFVNDLGRRGYKHKSEAEKKRLEEMILSNPEEKEKLLAEYKETVKEINGFFILVDNGDSGMYIKSLDDKLNSLEKQKNSLGMFDIGKKSKIEGEINTLSKQRKDVVERFINEHKTEYDMTMKKLQVGLKLAKMLRLSEDNNEVREASDAMGNFVRGRVCWSCGKISSINAIMCSSCNKRLN